jgi:hypothetical protein
MGNQTSSSSQPASRKSSRKSSKHKSDAPGPALLTDLQQGWAQSIRQLEQQDHPAAALLDSMCGPYLDPKGGRGVKSSYSEDYPSEEDDDDDEEEDEDSRTLSEEETTVTTDYPRRRRRKGGRSSKPKEDETTVDSRSYQRPSNRRDESSYDDDAYTEGDDTYERMTTATSMDETENTTSVDVGGGAHKTPPPLLHQPLASSFAKRCFFTKAGIGGHSQHYEGLTLSGNVILMLAAAMKLKGCPTICDEDLRRVEQTFPNQFSRLPDELLLSSGWRRISKYCHFSNKPIPDGIPFFRTFVWPAVILCYSIACNSYRPSTTRNTKQTPSSDCIPPAATIFYSPPPSAWSVPLTSNHSIAIPSSCWRRTIRRSATPLPPFWSKIPTPGLWWTNFVSFPVGPSIPTKTSTTAPTLTAIPFTCSPFYRPH